MIKAVIFDIDNTLYDFDKANTAGIQAAAGYCRVHFGVEEPETKENYLKAWRLVEQRVGTETAATHNRQIRFQCMMEMLDQPIFPHAGILYRLYWDTLFAHMDLSPGIEIFMKKLKEQNISIGIGTDMTTNTQYRKLEALGLSSYIDRMVTSEEAGVEKPHPKFFELCVKKAGCTAGECAFFGDNIKKDVEGAIAAGLHGIWFTQGKEPAEDVPFPYISSFTDLPRLSSVLALDIR